ncbi:MAG TPA: relaxase MobL [Candidatus Lumbricidophila sp.]|nr:relaxase MobL [Candidatus Lumbricidophila sp.]
MGLKQSIVVVNEFTVPLPGKRGGGGSTGTRGGTPGDYVLRYMARNNATESLAPIRRQRTDVFIERYMAREAATEALDIEDVSTLKRQMKKAQGQGGVAFGYGQVSLSDQALKAASKDVQRLFDSGHTVMKTVLSFDEEYLRKHKIVPEGFVPQRKGDYRGQIDQMKLRFAIMNGLDRMGRMLYDDLRYVAVIQVDTMHVHCHLAMVDAGPGAKASDGTQRGKIGDKAKSLIRRGIDSWLDEKQQVKHLSSAVGYERRNVTTFVKRWAHQQMLQESLPQFLLACLPADRRLWRYSTNAKSMQKPNRIVREIVEEALAMPGSPYPDAIARVQKYANYRRKNDGIDQVEWDRIVEQGRQRIIERGVNGVYGLLRALPSDALRIKTPMLDVMGLDYEDMAARAATKTNQKSGNYEDDLIGFGFRLRSYSSRLEHHTGRREHFHHQAKTWETANSIGAATPESQAMHRFYLEEEEYHARVAAKYRELLKFVPASTEWQPWVNDVTTYGQKLLSLESLRKDQSLRKMKDSQAAERLGRDIYGQSGGALMSFGDKASLAELDRRIGEMRKNYSVRVDELRMKLAASGLRLEQRDDSGELSATVGPEFPFEEVKALDLHHMRFDFARDVEVGTRSRRSFMGWAKRRATALRDALRYLRGTGQDAEIASLPVQDIDQMQRLAQSFEAGSTALPSEVSALAQRREAAKRSKTVRLGAKLQRQLHERIAEEARSVAVEPLEVDPTGPDTRER